MVFAGLAQDLSGKILLQVESNGEAWYINPDNQERYFMGRPSDAFVLMRSLGLGIAHQELETYLNSSFPARLSGKILLDVEMNGEAYYVNPTNLKGSFLGRPTDAFNIMRELGLGISNNNLAQITISVKSAPLPEINPLTPPPTEEDSPSETMPTDTEKAQYKITFNGGWSLQTHPNDFVSSAHFSPFVAYSHTGSIDARIFTSGQLASPGMKDMAETGATTMLNQEVDTLIASDRAYAKVQGGVFNAPGMTKRELEFTANHSHMTLVSMVAPSPDWFIAQSVDLYENGEWKDSITLDVVTYDAGTDSGTSFLSSNLVTDPREPIVKFDASLQSLGTITLERINN